MILAHLFVGGAYVGDFAQLERQPQRVSSAGRQILRSAKVRLSSMRLSASSSRVVGALIGDVGGGRGAIEQRLALLIVRRADLQDGARHAQPVGRIVRRDRRDLAEHLQAGARVVLLEGGVGVALERGGGLRDGAGIGLDLGFEPDGAVGEIVSLKWLVGALAAKMACKGKQRGDNADARERQHRNPP